MNPDSPPVPLMTIEMFYGTDFVDSMMARIGGRPGYHPEDEAVHILGLALLRLAGSCPAGWQQFPQVVHTAAMHLIEQAP